MLAIVINTVVINALHLAAALLDQNGHAFVDLNLSGREVQARYEASQ